MRYLCTACDHRFEADDDDARLRCPACMRRSSIVADRESGALRSVLSRVALVGVLAAALAASVWAGWAFLTSAAATDDDDGGTSAEPVPLSPDTSTLGVADAEAHAMVLGESGAREAVRAWLGRSPDPERAPLALSRLLRAELEMRRLVVLHDEVRRRRPALSPTTLADGVLAALVEREGAYLYPTELTLLVAALAQAAELPHDFVLLDPVEPTSEQLPTVAVRFHGADRDDVPLALDPVSAALRPALDLEGHGAELPWAMHGLMVARDRWRAGDVDGARERIAHASELVPELWLGPLLWAEIVRASGEREAHGAMAAELAAVAERADHPSAWMAAARAEAAGLPAPEAAALLDERLQATVDAFVFEAALAVELADRQAAGGEHEAARSMYELALERDPGVVGAHTGLARLYAGSDPERAHDHLRAELARHVDHAPAYLALAGLHLMYAEATDAERAAERGRAFAADRASFDAEWEAVRERRAP